MDVSTAQASSYDQEIARCERAIREAESREIALKEQRDYPLEAGSVLLWMISLPAGVLFLTSCVWAIASNG